MPARNYSNRTREEYCFCYSIREPPGCTLTIEKGTTRARIRYHGAFQDHANEERMISVEGRERSPRDYFIENQSLCQVAGKLRVARRTVNEVLQKIAVLLGEEMVSRQGLEP
jgi:hypothetical protein